MKPVWAIAILLASFSGRAAGQHTELEVGRAYYTEGEFKLAAAHFELALTREPALTGAPKTAECYYWMGMSYQRLADIALPFGGKYNAKARVSLTKALELAPGCRDYRRELFEFLLDPAVSSREASRQAAAILLAMPESDPDYGEMRQRFNSETKANMSKDDRLGRVFLAVPQAAFRIVELPGAALSHRHDARALKLAQKQSQHGQSSTAADR